MAKMKELRSAYATYLIVDSHLGHRIKPAGFDYGSVSTMLNNIFYDVPRYDIYELLIEYIDSKVLGSDKPHKIKSRLEDAILEIKHMSTLAEEYALFFTEKVHLEEIGSTREYIVGVSVLVKDE